MTLLAAVWHYTWPLWLMAAAGTAGLVIDAPYGRKYPRTMPLIGEDFWSDEDDLDDGRWAA